MTSRAKREERARSAAILHWFTFYAHVHKTLPRAATSERDYAALHDIVHVQALGHEDRALSLIEEIVSAPIPGDSLAARYAAFWAWHIAERPKHYSRPSRKNALEIRRCLRGAA